MASAVMGKRFRRRSPATAPLPGRDRRNIEILPCKEPGGPDGIKDVNEQLEFLMRPYGIMRRTVKLEDSWYRDAVGCITRHPVGEWTGRGAHSVRSFRLRLL